MAAVVELEGKRFLVTGGSGFIGSHVVDALVAADADQVVVFDNAIRSQNLERAATSGRVRTVEGDITENADVQAAAAGVDGVFHLAVLPLGPCIADPRRCHEVNVTGSLNVLEAACDAGASKIVFSSASSVYGDTHETMDESHPLEARTMYGASKIAAEFYVRAFNDAFGLDYVILRYMNVYGPRQEGGLVISVLSRILGGEAPVIAGDGSQSFDFVHVADVATANTAAMASDVDDDVYNVGSGGEATVREIVERLLAITGSDLEPEYRTDEPVVMTRRVGSSDRARERLGWEAARDLDEGLRDVVDWMRAR